MYLFQFVCYVMILWPKTTYFKLLEQTNAWHVFGLVCLLLCMLYLVCCVCRPGRGTITLFQSGTTEPHGPKGRFTEHTTTTLSLPSFVTNDFIISRVKEVTNFKLSLGEFWTWTNLNKYRQWESWITLAEFQMVLSIVSCLTRPIRRHFQWCII